MATSAEVVDETDVKEISTLANKYGSEFVNVFYKTLDNKRHVSLKQQQ